MFFSTHECTYVCVCVFASVVWTAKFFAEGSRMQLLRIRGTTKYWQG